MDGNTIGGVRPGAGRPRGFETDAALNAAMNLFWDQGYHAASVRDLVAATGVHKASLYATFGDKRRIFLAALDRYVDGALAVLAARLARHDSAIDAVREFLTPYTQVVSPAGRRGCLATRATMEFLPGDADVSISIRRFVDGIGHLLSDVLRRGQLAGEFDATVDAGALAATLFGLGQGLRVISAAQGVDAATLAAETALRLLPPPPAPSR